MPPGSRRSYRARKKKTVRWIVFAIILCSGMSCLAPVLYASTDCSRWLAEYKQGILQRRAARRLLAAKYRIVRLVHRPAPVHKHPMKHRMGPLESLRRFQVDCGDADAPIVPSETALIAPPPIEPKPAFVSFNEAPPELPPPGQPVVSEVPPLALVPLTPITPPSPPSEVPEPSTLLLVLTGAGSALLVTRRRLVAGTAI